MTAGHVRLAALAAALTLVPGPEPAQLSAQTADPCGSTTSTAFHAAPPPLDPGAPAKSTAASSRGPTYLDALWARRAANSAARAASVTARSYDAGNIAIVEDGGDLVLRPNAFDLRDRGVLLTPNAQGGYTFARIDYGFRRPLGTAIALADDDAREERLRFSFEFFGQPHERLFVNSDGNITFTESDTASSDRSVTRLLEGPPRIAAMFADLDPGAGGRVLIDSAPDAYSVTWCGVPEYGSRRRVTAQVTLRPGGAIEIQSSILTTVTEAIVAVSPGRTTSLTPVDLSAGFGSAAAGAIGERFTARSDLDTIATTQRFFSTHPDVYDNVVIFTDEAILANGGFAYELTIANDIQGLNLQRFDESAEWGSKGTLDSLLMMDALDKYPEDPHEVFLGTNSTVTVLGQEFGHRWLAFFTFRDASGRPSRQLLGRDNAHWSFFMDSDASVMEGNDIEDLGDGRFRTVAATRRYSRLDQYAMGLIPASDVPPFFVVQNPTEITPPRHAASSPEVGVTFKGIRRDVTIDEIIRIAGERIPSAAESKRQYHQAFILVTSQGRPVEPAQIEKLERIRVAWDQFVSAATDSRLRVDTRLQGSGP